MDFYQLRVGSRPNVRFRHVAPPLFQSRTSFVLHPVIFDETWVEKKKNQETSSVGRMFEDNLSVTPINAFTNLFTQTVAYLWQIEVKIFNKTHKSKVTSSPKTVFLKKKLKPNIKNYLNCKVSVEELWFVEELSLQIHPLNIKLFMLWLLWKHHRPRLTGVIVLI